MRLCSDQRHKTAAFTLAEVLIAIAVVAMFGIASFATNERLLVALKTQREATAATMMLQEQMEAFRSIAYSDLANTTVSATTSPPTTAADILANITTSEAQLGGITGPLSETITISAYMDNSGNSPPTTSAQTVWVRNSAYPTGHVSSSTGSLSTNYNSYDLIKVDIQVSWTSANGRTRNREITTICGRGNIGS